MEHAVGRAARAAASRPTPTPVPPARSRVADAAGLEPAFVPEPESTFEPEAIDAAEVIEEAAVFEEVVEEDLEFDAGAADPGRRGRLRRLGGDDDVRRHEHAAAAGAAAARPSASSATTASFGAVEEATFSETDFEPEPMPSPSPEPRAGGRDGAAHALAGLQPEPPALRLRLSQGTPSRRRSDACGPGPSSPSCRRLRPLRLVSSRGQRRTRSPTWRRSSRSASPLPPAPSEAAAVSVPVEMVEKIAQRVVAQISEKVVREIAWEVIPDLAEALIKQEIERLKAELQKI